MSKWLKSSMFYTRFMSTVVGCQTAQKIVSLTFDDGPIPGFTPQVLDILNHYEVQATFFLVGLNIIEFPAIAHKIVRAGHTVGNHGYSHVNLTERGFVDVFRELRNGHNVIKHTLGVHPVVMRPPYGARNFLTLLVARMLRYTVLHWSVSGEDWRGEPASTIFERVLQAVKPGSIILLHDGWSPQLKMTWSDHDLVNMRKPTIESLPMIIESLRGKGYKLIPITELLAMNPLVKQCWY